MVNFGNDGNSTTVADIEGFEKEYAIHSNGEVWNKQRNTKITLSKDRDGYLKCLLYKNNVRKYFAVHRLVATHFVPLPARYYNKKKGKSHSVARLEINHLDGNREHNDAKNLEWCTPAENKFMMLIRQKYKGPVNCQVLHQIYKKDKSWSISKFQLSELVYNKIKEYYTKNPIN